MRIGVAGCSFAAFLALPALSSCANLQDVRDFAAAGSQVSASEPVIAAWPHAYDVALARSAMVMRLARACRVRDHRDLTQDLRREVDATTADAVLAKKAADVLALYLATLASIADDKAADTSDERSALNGAVASLTGDASVKSAVSGLLVVLDFGLDGWRRHRLATIIRQADPSVQVLTRYLSAVTLTTARAHHAASEMNSLYWIRSGCRSEQGVQTLLLQAQADEARASDELTDKASAASTAYKKIAKDHAVLAENSGKLSGPAVKEVLRRDLPTLIATLKTFKAGGSS